MNSPFKFRPPGIAKRGVVLTLAVVGVLAATGLAILSGARLIDGTGSRANTLLFAVSISLLSGAAIYIFRKRLLVLAEAVVALASAFYAAVSGTALVMGEHDGALQPLLFAASATVAGVSFLRFKRYAVPRLSALIAQAASRAKSGALAACSSLNVRFSQAVAAARARALRLATGLTARWRPKPGQAEGEAVAMEAVAVGGGLDQVAPAPITAGLKRQERKEKQPAEPGASSLSLRAALRLLGVIALVAAFCYGAISLQHVLAHAQSGDNITAHLVVIGISTAILMCGLLLALQATIKRLGGWLLSLVVAALGFPVTYIRTKIWWVFFALTASVFVYSIVALSGASINQAGLYQNMLFLSGAFLLVGGAYQLHRYKWGDILTMLILLPLLPFGIHLLSYTTPQVQEFNAWVDMKNDSQGKKDLEGQMRHLESSIESGEQERLRGPLWRLIYPEPPIALSARAQFQKANVFVQMPNKGKEAFKGYQASGKLNPGHMYSGISAEEAARLADYARDNRRNLEKLIRSGQDGGMGTPNQPGQPGQQGQQQQEQRDKGRQPQPGSGRYPDNIL